ncbi:ankyrin repeat protein [Fusarium austroafricanum]|uniref:Ankyrin repeat protein n=1 Tax=Fusarium austroafricanum TaxID=2364996 RepID=A0A8H4KFR2_9HYPO|nr:ankyrin repeat protein [Fusarium austroafricanum]
MSLPTPGESISKLANRCAVILQELTVRSVSVQHNGFGKIVDDERGRFRVWAWNIGALQPERSMSSLDARLRDAPRQHGSVIRGLERLQSITIRIQQIVVGANPNRSAQSTPGISDKPTNELDQLLTNLHSSINHLFSLSTLLRRMKPKGRLPMLADFVPSETSPDIKHVEDKFPKTKRSPWLAQRLGNAITKRRLILQYRQNHHQKLAKVAAPLKGDVDAGSKAQSTLATTYKEGTKETTTKEEARYSIFTSATSFVSSYGEDIGRQIPDLPDMVLDAVQLGYGEPIECPYCRTIQEVADRNQWRKHVFSDLQPYVCTFEDCTSDLFFTREEWFSHEINLHRQDWVCILCNKSDTVFSSGATLRNHFREAHSEVNNNQLQTILEAFVESQNIKEFCRHLARHQQMLALEALPISVDGLELNTPASDQQDSDDPEDDHLEMLTCVSCSARWSSAGYGIECPICNTEGLVTYPPARAAIILTDPQPPNWEDIVTSDDRIYFVHGRVVWPEPSDQNDPDGDNQDFHPGEYPGTPFVDITEDGSSEQEAIPSEEADMPNMNDSDSGGYNTLWLAASLFEFNIVTTKMEGGYPYLVYQEGEIFDVVGEKGDLWLAKNQDDPYNTLGWIWSKHFARLNQG